MAAHHGEITTFCVTKPPRSYADCAGSKRSGAKFMSVRLRPSTLRLLAALGLAAALGGCVAYPGYGYGYGYGYPYGYGVAPAVGLSFGGWGDGDWGHHDGWGGRGWGGHGWGDRD